MAKTVLDVITQVRYQLQDEDATAYRYSNVRLVNTLNAAMSEIYRLRRDLFLANNWSLPTYADTDLVGDVEVALDDAYFIPLVYYIVALVQLENDMIAPDSKSDVLLRVSRGAFQGSA